MAKVIRSNRYRLNDHDLTSMALSYAGNNGLEASNFLDFDCPKIGLASDEIFYKDQSNIELTACFDDYIGSLVNRANLRSDTPKKSIF